MGGRLVEPWRHYKGDTLRCIAFGKAQTKLFIEESTAVQQISGASWRRTTTLRNPLKDSVTLPWDGEDFGTPARLK